MTQPPASELATDRATHRILRGRLGLELARFGTPLAVAMGLQTTFNLVDTYVISRLGPDVTGPALGAIGICDQIAAIGTIVSYGISIATAALIAQHQGRGDRDQVGRLAWQSVLMVGLLAVGFGALGGLFAGPLMRNVVGAKGAVAELGCQYLRVIVGGSFSIFFLLHLTSIQRALGSSKTPLAILVGSNVLNLFLAVLLVYGPGEAPAVFSWGPPLARALGLPRLELVGAAWATVLARTAILIPLVILVERRFGIFRRHVRAALDWPVVRSVLDIGWPASFQLVVRILAMLLTQSLVARAFTTDADSHALTALGVVFRLETLALFVSLGWGSAAQTFLGQNLGAGQVRRAVASGWVASAFNGVAMAALAAAYVVWGPEIVAFFDETPEVVGTAASYLRIVAPAYVLLGTGIVLGSAITGAGATRLTLAIDAAVVALFQLPVCVLAITGPHASEPRLWWALVATYLLSAICYWIAFRNQRFIPARFRTASMPR